MALKDYDFVKIICAAGNENHISVYNICLAYTVAGADCIDLAASSTIVEYAKKGVEVGLKVAKDRGLERVAPVLCVSIGMEGDQHVRKARVTDIGKDLIALTKSCPVNAIVGGTDNEPVHVIESRCIGIGACDRIKPGAIEFHTPKRNLEEILPACKKEGATMFELHANTGTLEEVLKQWNYLNSLNPEGYISMCIGRSYLSNQQIIERVEKIMEITKERTIIQADGIPMTGFQGNVNCTLQAVATGDLIMKMKNRPYILLSGGTNLKTAELANYCGIKVNGISFGTNARIRIQKYLFMENLIENENGLNDAIEKATSFVATVKNEMRKNVV